MLLVVNSVAHLLVDGLCAATVFGRIAPVTETQTLILLYNTLAFSTQCFVGLLADRVKRDGAAAAASMLLIVLGYALPFPPWLRVCCIGLGNSVFHVAGGCMTLRRSRGRAGELGVFVAPGALGLALGTLFPGLGGSFALLLMLCAVIVVPLEARSPACDTPGMPQREAGGLVPALLALAVAVRAVGGTVASFPWKQGAALTLLTVLAVSLGKGVGGFVCDGLGARRTALLSLLPAAVLIAFCTQWMLPSLAGQLALNLTMPVTLWLLYRAVPKEPGFAFGLAASALWPGTLVGQMMRHLGGGLRLGILCSVLFGLGAILYAEKVVLREEEGR